MSVGNDDKALITQIGEGVQSVTVYGEPSNRSAELTNERLDELLARGEEDAADEE